MQLFKTLPYVFLSATILLIIPLFFGFSQEAKTFGISGTIAFEDVSAKGARVVFTTSDKNPFEAGTEENALHFEQYLQNSGYFYRKLNEKGGENINIWIKQEGYPVIEVNRVLDTNDDQISFGVIKIPAKLKLKNQEPVEFFKAPCENEPIVTIEPGKIRAVRNFCTVECKEYNTIQFKAKIDLLEEAKVSVTNTGTIIPSLAVVVF
jgi:hypothetical protein